LILWPQKLSGPEEINFCAGAFPQIYGMILESSTTNAEV
jgi:hypothetical protein